MYLQIDFWTLFMFYTSSLEYSKLYGHLTTFVSDAYCITWMQVESRGGTEVADQ
jgi:hypothetical protein